jgi:hypothetical protein
MVIEMNVDKRRHVNSFLVVRGQDTKGKGA